MAPRVSTEERAPSCAHAAGDVRPIAGKPTHRYCEGCTTVVPLSAVGRRKEIKSKARAPRV